MTILELFQAQQNYVKTHQEPDVLRLKEQLIMLRSNMIKHEQDLYDAFQSDFHKSQQEVYLTEYAIALNELNWFIKKLNKIYRTKSYYDPLWIINQKTFTRRQGYGTTIIYSPYNYPFNLSMVPLIGSIAMNNTVILKPASYTKAVTQVMKTIIEETFSPEQCCIVDETWSEHLYDELYSLDPDLVFFTGSEAVGRKIYENYSSKLIPVVLELGGKCPVIVDDTFDVNITAKRLVWGKMVNNGQTCVAPDYVIVQESVKQQLIEALIQEFNTQYPAARQGEDIAYSVNKKSLAKFNELLQGQNIVAQLKTNDNQLGFTIVDVTKEQLDSDLMQTEIFGPILPICTFKTKEDILNIVQRNNYPLASYAFTTDKEFFNWLFWNIKTGAFVQNDVLVHCDKMSPFGGIKNSGVGQYHKWNSVTTFSQLKPMVKASRIDVPARYAPYTSDKLHFLKKFYK
ncbi:aldehyde dehydrogenase family protein [Ureaplasma ceti]|uniref:Aldehyde dehydrogenase n=1 Tax=Ureaplasma ceti TaxID=3119530 RepID=A0ABP9U8C0_9BACT